MNVPFELINYRESHPIAIIIQNYWLDLKQKNIEMKKKEREFCLNDTAFDVMKRMSMLLNEDEYFLMDRAFELQRIYSYI